MKNFIIVVLALVAVAYLGAQVAGVIKTRTDFAQRVDRYLDLADEKSIAEVKTQMVAEAQQHGIELEPADIRIVIEATDVQSLAQKMTSKIAEARNQRVTITVRYEASILGIRWPQEITRTKIRQVSVQRRAPSELEQMMDVAPRF